MSPVRSLASLERADLVRTWIPARLGALLGAMMAMAQGDLRAHVERLARTPRVPGTRGHADACAYVEGQLRLCGYEPRRATETDGQAVNVHAMVGHPKDGVFVVGAHYDSVVDSPGADDNASGVAALLEVARTYAGTKLKMAVEFVAYDLEERPAW